MSLLAVIKNMVSAAEYPPTEGQAFKSITVCFYLPYSLDLALCDILLLPKVKITIKGKCFT